ncbi:hypothetical protein PTKIN_Ptkin07bG0057200 [Pterospermum kingtungense]
MGGPKSANKLKAVQSSAKESDSTLSSLLSNSLSQMKGERDDSENNNQSDKETDVKTPQKLKLGTSLMVKRTLVSAMSCKFNVQVLQESCLWWMRNDITFTVLPEIMPHRWCVRIVVEGYSCSID